VNHPATNDPVVFIDTPGFDDASMEDTVILMTIAEWLVKVWVRYIG
jgi:hypothetical protein